MKIDRVPYGGWQNCVHLANDEIELIATTDVGPRIIRFGFIGDVNEFVEFPDQMGKTGGTEYRGYGGHRLWLAPESKELSYHPDNQPVGWTRGGDELLLKAPVESTTRIQKEMHIRLDAKQNRVQIVHQLTNHNPFAVTLAAWALSVMAPGGRAIVPQEPYRPHPEALLPARPLVLWSYTKMNDPRWTWGEKYIQLRQDPKATIPQKVGMLNGTGWAAYANGDHLFIKRFYSNPDAMFPDFGCNLEMFTNAKMLEVESLSPLTTLDPGGTLTHEEEWSLHKGITIGNSDKGIDQGITSLL
ncbi:MAG: hypothetical protein WEE20_15735 [Bacteroidota bacterium]